MTLPRKLLSCLAAALAVAAISAPGASGATEVGSNCTGPAPASNYTMVPLSLAPGSPLPLAAPAAGVVTKWKVNSGLPPGFPASQRLRVFRAAAAANEFQTIAESAVGTSVPGINTFETRIPVLAGDRFGAYASPGSFLLLCPTSSAADVLGIKEADVAPGSTATYTTAEKLQLALSVVIEADADGDGFGDETQDKCPQNAAQQLPCPVLKLKAFGMPPTKGAVRVLVASDSQASITVSASAKIPKGKKSKGTKTTQLSPVVQLVSPGELITYTINFNKALKDALKALPRKRSLKLEIVAAGKSLSGAVTSEPLTVKLKGQAKPAPRAKG